MMEKKKHYGLTMDETTYQKIKSVAKYDGRSVSGLILHLVQKCIWEFEKEHGEIE